VLLLFAPFENSKWPPAEVKVCTETLWETTFSSSSFEASQKSIFEDQDKTIDYIVA
jgi:hypothetical protein